MFSTSGDGMKSYFTYAWHIKYDTTAIAFQGMNYPYGEHFMYTDCHPIFTLAFRALKPIFPGIVDYSVGFLNFFMIFSFVLTALFLWLVFKVLKVDPFLSVLGSIGIMMLAPQVFRLTGHLALSYSFFIPLTLYLTLKFFGDQKKRRWLWLQMVNILFWFFIHAYLGMMAAGFLLGFWVIHFIKNFKTLKSEIAAWLPLILWVILPVMFFVLFVNLTDSHSGRTSNPSGFFLNNAEPDDIIIPHMPPLRPYWDKMTKIYQNWEGWSYFGLTSFIVVIFIFISTLITFIKKRRFEFSQKLLPDHHFKIAIWASLVLLIFSFGMPFKLYPPMLDWIPQIKQFRATGRFAWFFYFTSTIMAVVVLNNLVRNISNVKYRKAAYVLVVGMVLFYSYEGLPYHQFHSSRLTGSSNLFSPANYDEHIKAISSRIDPSNYQAVLPLPFYYNGSENFTIRAESKTLTNVLLFSYYTGLPVIGSQLTRTSIEESKNIVQLISPGFYPKDLRFALPSDAPILILKSPLYTSPYQLELQDKSIWVTNTDHNVLYELPLNALFKNTAEDEIGTFYSIRPSLYDVGEFLASDSSGFLYFDSFDSFQSEILFSKPGAVSGTKKGIHTLAGFEGGTFEAGKIYVASLWMYNGHQDALNFWFRLMAEEYDEPNNRYNEHWVLPEQSEVINGNWSLVEIEFTLENPQNFFALKLRGKDMDHARFIADDLLIREKGVDIYRVLESENSRIKALFKNNHRIRMDESY
jgi:hypothetical protein